MANRYRYNKDGELLDYESDEPPKTSDFPGILAAIFLILLVIGVFGSSSSKKSDNNENKAPLIESSNKDPGPIFIVPDEDATPKEKVFIVPNELPMPQATEQPKQWIIPKE